MTVLPIIKYPDGILSQVAKPVEHIAPRCNQIMPADG